MSHSPSSSPRPQLHSPQQDVHKNVDDQDQDNDHDQLKLDRDSSKRKRTDSLREDKARGKRLMGNILGTLQKFQKDDRSVRSSEAAKRREQLSSRIEAKLRSESNLRTRIAETEKEIKTLRIATESAEYFLKHKIIALAARHESLKVHCHYLTTFTSNSSNPVHPVSLIEPSPTPLAQGPILDRALGQEAKPLYFLPKILLSHQQEKINDLEKQVESLIATEKMALEEEKSSAAVKAKENEAKAIALEKALMEYRSQLISENHDTQILPEEEKGVQIQGEDGDVEVEY